MSDVTALRRSKGSNLAKLAKAAEALTSNARKDDSGDFWKCELDKSANGYAIIRFLPTPPQDVEKDGLPWAKYWDHGFQGPGGWYIEKSLTTIGAPDPLSEVNSRLWESGLESDKEIARKQKRRLHYVSNIYIVKDPKNPHNEGKVFKFTYGKKIFEKLTGAMNPQFADDVAIDPFDLDEGANFKLKIRKVDGYQNYDLSDFDSAGALFDDDDKMDEIWKSEFSLLEVVDIKNFKSYDELKSRLNRVLGQSNQPQHRTAESYTAKSVDDVEDEEFMQKKVTEKKVTQKLAVTEDEDDSDLDYFNKLLED
jgi:hypothetical protein